ncbi:hypothetical protein [Neobacillus sp. PS3-40]|uniref:hypothetical protein n=1 Tax=Neobacillus sp. PS3-40 TaxID=3070679 RepID=UPI0027DFCD9B|nr:hypothetical protein [Neobacillus sp. PS3-40]WML45442.1 hypothetical protein RCG20_05945 [Neobacillus sp. PS3-40]
MGNNSDEFTIRLKRTSQFANCLRKFKIFLNNVHVNDIGDGEEVVIPIEKGHHELYIAIDWVKSKTFDININDGQEIKLLCGSPLEGAKLFIPFLGIIGTFVPKWYLFIKKR